MAIVIEGFSVVVRLDCIRDRFSHPTFTIPNSTALFDDHLWRCAFMAEADARSFLHYLGKLGMKVEPGRGCEALVVDEFDVREEQPCEWLKVAKWDKAVVAWRAGTEPDTVVAGDGWDPQKSSGFTRSAVADMEHLDFLSEKDGVETYLHKDTGRRVYIGRTKPPLDTMFARACEVIKANFVHPGGKPVCGEVAHSVLQAVSDLEQIRSLESTRWNVHWFLGKGMQALGRTVEAHASFRNAFELESGVEAVPRELAGVCLELGRFEEAVTAAQRATELAPGEAETLGNLALAQLMVGQLSAAKASIAKALGIAPGDPINLRVRRLINEVDAGTRAQPKTLGELTKPAAQKKPFWKVW